MSTFRTALGRSFRAGLLAWLLSGSACNLNQLTLPSAPKPSATAATRLTPSEKPINTTSPTQPNQLINTTPLTNPDQLTNATPLINTSPLGSTSQPGEAPFPSNAARVAAPNSILISDAVPLDARIEGVARGPFGLVGGNSLGLVGGNSLGLVGGNSLGLVGGNSLGYHVQTAYLEEPVKRAMVYLTDSEGRFYVEASGEIVAGMTDDLGRFKLPKCPSGRPVFVNVMLSAQRRMVGFLVPLGGDNRFDVNTATTLVAEVLRDQSARRRQSPSGLDLNGLGILTQQTQSALDNGDLGPVDARRNSPDLTIARIPELVNQYLGVVARVPGLAVAWRKTLGYRPLRFQPLYAAAQTSEDTLEINKILMAANGDLLFGGGGFLSAVAVSLVERGFATDSVNPQIESSARDRILMAQSPGIFSECMGDAALSPSGYVLVAPCHADLNWILRIDPAKVFPGNWLKLAPMPPARRIVGVTCDAGGNLYFSDAREHVIRRVAAEAIAVASGSVATVSAPVVAGAAGATGSVEAADPLVARFDRPSGLAFDGSGVLIADFGNRLVRKLGVGVPEVPRLVTLLGGGLPALEGGGPFGLFADDGAQAASVGLRGPQRIAPDGKGRLAVLDGSRVLLFSGNRAITVLSASWGRFQVAGESRRVDLPGLSALAWSGSSLLVGSLLRPYLSRVEIPPEAEL